MATYTMPLKAIIEQPTQNRNDLTLKQRLEVGRVNFFKDIDYPIFNENYRSEFETKFIRYFYNKEIGFETESLFKFELETWLQINMPYYNQLFESELLEYDPLTNIAMQFDQDLKQDSTMDTTRDNQEDSTTNTVTQSSFEHDTQRDTETDTTSNHTQNTVTDSKTDTVGNVKTQSDTVATKGVTGHSETDTTQDSNTTSTTDTTSNSNTHTESNTTQNAFNRKIDSDTPDNRLNLSSNDGSGVIEYASNIAETMDKSTGDTVTDTNTTDQTNSSTNTTDKTTSNSVTDTTENTHDQSNTTSNQDTTETTDQLTNQDVTENTTSNSVTDDTTKQTGWDHSQTDGKGQIIGNIVGRDVGNKLENLYNERYGKDGTITYQQMIQELRSTFLRIERQIFREMTELFMLLY